MRNINKLNRQIGKAGSLAIVGREASAYAAFMVAMLRLSGFEINSRSLYGIWGGISSLFAEKLAMSWQNSNLFPPRTYIWPTSDHLLPSENSGLFALHCGLVGRCQCEVCHLIPAKVGKPRLRMKPNWKSTHRHIIQHTRNDAGKKTCKQNFRKSGEILHDVGKLHDVPTRCL